MIEIKQFVAWGHKLHTHSYIHFGYVKAFEYLGYKVLWLDNRDNISNIDFSNSVFLTEGQVEKGIPIRDDCYYILHNCSIELFQSIDPIKKLTIQVYTHDVLKRNTPKISAFYWFSDGVLYMPWATDLLPHEIDQNINDLDSIIENSKKEIILCGTMTHIWFEPWNIIRNCCLQNNIKFTHYSPGTSSPKENMEKIQNCFMAPAIQPFWQVDNGYLPCRIFKNISYGKMGITNNEHVYDLFDKKIIYDSNIEKVFHMGLDFENNTLDYKKSKIIPLMEMVRDNHTYINRVNITLQYFNQEAPFTVETNE